MKENVKKKKIKRRDNSVPKKGGQQTIGIKNCCLPLSLAVVPAQLAPAKPDRRQQEKESKASLKKNT